MGECADRLLDHMQQRTGFDVPYADVKELQIAAMNERFQEQVDRIKLVAMRAKEAGIT